MPRAGSFGAGSPGEVGKCTATAFSAFATALCSTGIRRWAGLGAWPEVPALEPAAPHAAQASDRGHEHDEGEASGDRTPHGGHDEASVLAGCAPAAPRPVAGPRRTPAQDGSDSHDRENAPTLSRWSSSRFFA